MSAQDSVKVVQDMMAASRDRNEERYLSFFAEDVVMRAAGVPKALGGVTQGKDQIRENFRNAQPGGAPPQVRTIFADDKHVCLEERVSSNFNGTQVFKGSGKPYTTNQCIVYELEGGRIKSSTAYINFLDVYVQAGMVDVGKLTV
ncbi:MAG: nuclear transport factor 2 family protein [Chloroflexota bacterium]|nr:nuclear transport factor 2 family protein [Chloroflexota bacterium]